MQPAPDFPPELAHVPLTARLRSRRGWGFGVVGAGALLVAGVHFVYFVLGGFSDLQVLEIFGGALLVAGVGLAVQAVRLFKPITVALLPGRVGVYEGEKFARSAALGEVIEFRLNLANTLREFLAFGILGVGGLIGAIAYAVDALNSGSINLLLPITWAIAAAIVCIGLFTNSIWTRALAKHYFVRGSGKSYTVVFQKSELRRAGWLK